MASRLLSEGKMLLLSADDDPASFGRFSFVICILALHIRYRLHMEDEGRILLAEYR